MLHIILFTLLWSHMLHLASYVFLFRIESPCFKCHAVSRENSHPIVYIFEFILVPFVREHTTTMAHTPQSVGRGCQPKVRYPYTSTHTDTWDIVKHADQSHDGSAHAILLYARGHVPQGDPGAEYAQGWTREHCWPKSYGGERMNTNVPGMGTDAHNLFCADASMNSTRSNKTFDDGGETVVDRSPIDPSVNPGGLTRCRTTDTTWEPPDEAKGVVARALFYMACAYAHEGLCLGERPCADRQCMGKLSTLLAWHCRFPPTSWERRRTRIVARYQGNLNPFVVTPTLAHAIDWTHRVVVVSPIAPPMPTIVEDRGNECNGNVNCSFPNPRTTEIHYDNRGRDVGEGFELEIPIALAHSDSWMRRLRVCMYNGADGRMYRMVFGDELEAGVAYMDAGVRLYYWHGRLQNGRGDAIAVVVEECAVERVVEFLSWEGVCEATDGPCEGRTSTCIGVREDGNTRIGASLQRLPGGQWCVSSRANFGFRNAAGRLA